jgi:signal transduction histidine kinase
MRLFGGIRLRLMLALLVVAAGALAVAYAIVVPRLENRLVDAKLDQLEKDARLVAGQTELDELTSAQPFAEAVSNERGARVVVYQIVSRRPLLTVIQADSRLDSSLDVERSAVVRRSAENGSAARGVVVEGDQRWAEVAAPATARDDVVVLLRDSLSDPLSSVQFVERRLFLAGVLALFVALVLGFAASSMHARRIRRLERAADRIAGGRFDEPVVDGGNDELGQLAVAFERMRTRLENLDRARREFIANASHELRTPLFSLGGFLELLDDEELDEPTRREFVGTMREQVERLTKLATDLLDLTRLDAGRIHVESERVELRTIAELLEEEFRPLAERRDHRLEVHVDGEPAVIGDELRLLQVGRALVDNALVHTPRGSSVVIRAWHEAGSARLSIADDGPGIPAEHIEHVFDRFYRADAELASGSGLGLAIARELAAVMQGSVTLESRPGRTVATLSLPAAPAAVPSPVFT